MAAARAAALQTFSAGAITIRRQLGQLGFATETEWDYFGGERNPLDQSQPARTVESSSMAVRLFDAQLSDGRRVLLKEYVGTACDLGRNELDVYSYLLGPQMDGGELVGALLGHLITDASFDSEEFVAQWRSAMPAIEPPVAGNLWLVFAWEGLATLSAFPAARQDPAWWDADGRVARSNRRSYVRAACAGALRAVASLHNNGVVHRSLGGASLLVSTLDQAEARKLVVKARTPFLLRL